MADTDGWIQVRGARVHNLQNLDIDLPRGRLTVLTGPSGSGKSSLAFDTLYAEGQRRYLETLRVNTRALFDQLQRPDVDLVAGLPPTLCVNQQAGRGLPRSTLATLTEVHDHLRLLWARLGVPHCRNCGRPMHRQPVSEIVHRTLELEPGRKVYLLAPLVRDRKGEHKEVFQQIRQSGFLRARVDGILMEVRDNPKLNAKQGHTVELVVDRLVIRPGIQDRLSESLATAVKFGQGTVIVTDIDDGDWHDHRYSTRNTCPDCLIDFRDLEPRLFSFNGPQGACLTCMGLGLVWQIVPEQLIPNRQWNVSQVLSRIQELLPDDDLLPALDTRSWHMLAAAMPHPEGKTWSLKSPLADWPDEAINALLHGTEKTTPPYPGLMPELRRRLDDDESALSALAGFLPCPDCGGKRLNAEARAVRFAGKGIHEVTAMTVSDARAFFRSVQAGGFDSEPASEGVGKIRSIILQEIEHRLRFLEEVGLGYLTLDRPAGTLSGGEAQRARLATHLGGGLLGVCYIVDEPTVGLHPRDTDRLLEALRALQQRGNTMIVVEHDEAVIRHADYLVDMGPGAGPQGGRIVAKGTLAEVLANPASVTAAFLRERQTSGGNIAWTTRQTPEQFLVIRGARHHNLKDIDVPIPLGRLVCVTGVSGSGKSSLARDILCHAARRHLGLPAPLPGLHDHIEGLEQIDKVIEVDQAPLGRSSRSSAATYTGIFDEVRKVFANTKPAKVRGYKAHRFSFNVKGGRCEECQGHGQLRVPLQFLPDLSAPCPLCRGKRFHRATLEITYKGKNIADVLDMSVAEALQFFSNIPSLARPLEALVQVGLGYLALGQPATALSGGEAQRVKLATQLARWATGKTLYLLDEPTTGLHFADVANLLRVFQHLVNAGNTLVVIEHHLDVIGAADWIIDLGPEGGDAGGQLMCAGPPMEAARNKASITGRYLQLLQSS
jgi:excinuclease ABC subunit A